MAEKLSHYIAELKERLPKPFLDQAYDIFTREEAAARQEAAPEAARPAVQVAAPPARMTRQDTLPLDVVAGSDIDDEVVPKGRKRARATRAALVRRALLAARRGTHAMGSARCARASLKKTTPLNPPGIPGTIRVWCRVHPRAE